MASRQDQLHSYQFAVQRVVAALVMHDTDPVQSPFRRLASATLAGVLVAAIALGGFVVYGTIRGDGGDKWRDSSAVIVERESGARYVFQDGKLHLVLNYASALLIIGTASPRTVLVPRRAIEGVPRGGALGIAGAPDSLPAAGRLLGPPWTVCSTVVNGEPGSTLLVGGEVSGGNPLGVRAILAGHPDGSVHVIWRNRRHLVRDRSLVLSALGWSTERPVPVAPALLAVLPAGGELTAVRLRGAGDASDAVSGARIGEVFVVSYQGGGRQYAVALRDGLAGITQVQADLLLTASAQPAPTALSQGRFAALPKVADLVPSDAAAPPAVTPELESMSEGGGGLCARIPDDSGVSDVRTGAVVPSGAAVAGDPRVDSVVVEPGRGAIVEAVSAPGATGGAMAMVTDLGRRHPLAGDEVLSMLGYGGVRPLRLPASLVSLLPAGAALDPAAARAPAR